jgi:hypothetical protein
MKWYNTFQRPHPAGDGKGLEMQFTPAPLAVGWIVHEGLAAYYRSGWEDGKYDVGHAISIVKKATAVQRFASEEDHDNALATSAAIIEKYHLWTTGGQGHPDFPHLRIAADHDGNPLIERDFEVDLGYKGCTYTGRLDAVVSDGGLIRSFEHKTAAASTRGRLITDMSLNTQVTGQCFLLEQCLPDYDTQGVLINVIVKNNAKTSPPVFRDITVRSPERLEKFKRDVLKTLKEIEDCMEAYKHLQQSGGMSPDEAAREVFLMNTTKCVDFAPCTYFSMCKHIGKEDAMAATFRPREFFPRVEE